MYHPHPSGNHHSHLEAEHLLLPGNCSATWGEVAPSERSPLHRSCHKCLYVNDSMSDNLQSQPLPFKPPDRMTSFISRTFNVACFTHTPLWAIEGIIQGPVLPRSAFIYAETRRESRAWSLLSQIILRFKEIHLRFQT